MSRAKILSFPNGLQAVFYPLENVRAVGLELYVKTGFFYENEETVGISHLTEHIVNSGSKTYPSPLIMTLKEEDLGVFSRNQTTGEATIFHRFFPRENLKSSLKLLKETVFNPLFSEKAIKREKSILSQEYLRSQTSLNAQFSQKFSKIFFGENHPYSFLNNYLRLWGNLAKLTSKEISKLHQKYYLPSNMILGLVGDLKIKEVEKLILKTFCEEGTKKKPLHPHIPNVKFRKKKFLFPQKIKQASLSFYFPLPGWRKLSKKKVVIFYIISLLLGGLRSSRLNLLLRDEKGLVYSVSSHPVIYDKYGLFYINTSSSSENITKLISLIIKAIDDFKKNGISDQEFKRIKKILYYREILRFESSSQMVSWLTAEFLHWGEVWFPEDYRRLVDDIERTEIKETARHILNFNKATLGIMGPSQIKHDLKFFEAQSQPIEKWQA